MNMSIIFHKKSLKFAWMSNEDQATDQRATA